MSEYQFFGWKLSDLADAGAVGNGQHPICARLSTDAQAIFITANDGSQSNPDSASQRATPVTLGTGFTIDGMEFPAGSQIVADTVLKTDDTSPITLIIGRIVSNSAPTRHDDLQLVFTSAALTPGRLLNLSAGCPASDDGPGQNCFARATLIDTPHGALPIEQLEDGDEVLTHDGSVQLISWIGKRRLSGLELVLQPNLQPVRIMAGALTGGRPGRDLIVSQQHRLLVDDWRAPYLFGEEEILVPARSLLNNRNVAIDCPRGGVEYFHLLLNGHTLICANGVWAETMVPDGATVQMLDPAQRARLVACIAENHAGEPDAYRTVLPALCYQTTASAAA